MALGIALGAFGAHALGARLSADMRAVYQTAVLYHLIHGLGLLVVGVLSLLRPSQSLIQTAGWLLVVGVVLFSGSLYLLAVTGIKKLGMITPFGGLALMIGWVCLLLSSR